MTSEDYRHFVCIVAGDNPDELMKDYDKNKKTEPYVVYKLNEANKLKDTYVSYIKNVLNTDISEDEKLQMQEMLDEVNNKNDIEFFNDFTKDYEHDEDTGDAITNENNNGKWSSYNLGKHFSMPFILNDGTTSFQAKKCDIDWFRLHHYNTKLYESVWELCIEHRKPENESEENILKNMGQRTTYLNKFGTKKNYVESCTAFWGYAFLSNTTGWKELEPDVNQFEWMNGYMDNFINNLDDNTLLTIYECVK